MKEFVIEESDELLIIKLTSTGKSQSLFIELLIMLVGYMIVFSIPYIEIFEFSPLLAIIYLLPLLRIRKFMKAGKDFLSSKSYKFDK